MMINLQDPYRKIMIKIRNLVWRIFLTYGIHALKNGARNYAGA